MTLSEFQQAYDYQKAAINDYQQIIVLEDAQHNWKFEVRRLLIPMSNILLQLEDFEESSLFIGKALDILEEKLELKD